MENARQVRLGRTELHVPRIWFGTNGLGKTPAAYPQAVFEARARETIHTIFESPVNALDTARIYGKAEVRIGHVIRERGRLPERFVIATKLDRDPKTHRFDAGRARRSLEESLTALGLERVHLLYLHDPEHATSIDEITAKDGPIAELMRMKDEGLTQAIGLAAGPVDVMMPILRSWDFDVLLTHNRFTLANRNAEPMIEFAQDEGIAVLNAAPYGSGLLAKGAEAHPRYAYRNAGERTLGRVQRMEAICAASGVPLGAAALQFSMRDPRITATVCGVSKPERIAQTLEWAAWPIPEEVWTALLALPFETADPQATRA